MTRLDGRASDIPRPVQIDLGLQRNPEGSVLYRCGGTTVLVSASVDEGVPDFLKGSARGWLTAEYAMHPRANPRRQTRDGRRGRIDGRTQEIQRLVGRSLRAAVDFKKLGERTISIDCDVLDADGGTRTAAVTGGWLALALAVEWLRARGLVEGGILHAPVAAVSVGLVEGLPMLDLCYTEDRDAEVDLNVVGTARGNLIEVQGTAEDKPISRKQFDAMLDLALAAIPDLAKHQKAALESAGIQLERLVSNEELLRW